MTKNFIFFLIFVGFIFLILHLFGWYKFYYTTIWYDKLLHFLAGISIVLIIWWLVNILEKARRINKKSFFSRIFISLLFLLVIAVLWEVFEFGIDKVFDLPSLQLGFRDTFWDLTSDILGGFFGVVLIFAFYFYRGKFVVK